MGRSARDGSKVGYLLWRVTTKWRASVDRAVAHLGLTHAQYSALATLYGMSRDGAEPSQRELADATGLDAIYISKLSRALETAGFIHRGPHRSDPRAVALTLTPRGVQVVTEAMGLIQDLLDELTRPLGGKRGARTQELVAALEILLDAPL
jgi:DNA-binding MarR family transcriptional regulator